MKKAIIPILVLFLVITIVSAQPPFDPEQSSFSTELEIVFPQTQNFKLNAVVNLSFHVFNSSGILMDNESISCHGHIFGLQNQHITAQNLSWDGRADFEFIALPTDTLGLFSYFVWCKPTGLTSVTEGGFVSAAYEVTRTGSTDGKNLLFIMLAAITVVSFYLLMMFKLNDFPMQFASAGLALINIVYIIGISYGGYIGTDLSGLLRWQLYVTTILFFSYAIFIYYRITAKAVTFGGYDPDKGWGKKW